MITPFVGLEQRKFCSSNYKRCYAQAVAPVFQHDLLHAVHSTLKLFATRLNPALNPGELVVLLNDFMTHIQEEAFRHDRALKNDVAVVAEYLWTSSEKHAVVKDMELCSVLNAVIRDDIEEEVEAAVPIVRSINVRRVNRARAGGSVNLQSFPPNGQTWRGGGFRDQFRDFFTQLIGSKYRVPGFLATSVKKSVAMGFALAAPKNHSCALWCIQFDPRGELNPHYRVRHMTFVNKTLIPGEGEYLFAPYSVFTLVSINWSANRDKPHEFTILAARDNKNEDENLPLALWY